MSVFAVLHSSTPTSPRAALALAFPDQSISVQAPFRIVVPGLDVTSVTPGRPNFLFENLGFEPAVSMHFVLDKTALATARSRLADATRSFLRGAAGSVVVLYGDVPVVARRPWGAWVRHGYHDLVEPEGWQVVQAVVIPRPEPAASPAQSAPVDELLGRFIAWEYTDDAESPFSAELDGRSLAVRVNHLPAEPPYTLVGDGVDLISLDEWPDAWRKPAAPPHVRDQLLGTREDADTRDQRCRPVTMITADVLSTWSRRLCSALGGAADIAHSLGLTGSLTEHGDYWDLTPPPGATRVMLVKAATDHGIEGIDHIDIKLAEPSPRGALDTRFGSGQPLTRVHPGRPYKIAYHVTVPGAPYTCEVIAAFTDEPTTPATLAHGVILRRDRSTP
jgi:hypothetical protein